MYFLIDFSLPLFAQIRECYCTSNIRAFVIAQVVSEPMVDLSIVREKILYKCAIGRYRHEFGGANDDHLA